MDTTPVLDALSGLIASGCLLLLVYGAWLCMPTRLGGPKTVQESAARLRAERSARRAVQAERA